MRDILLFSFASLSRPSVSFIRAKMRAICQGNAFERNDSIFSCGAIESGRDRDESLIDILTEFCPSLVFYLFYKEREKNVKESANHQKLSFKRQEHEG